MNQRRRALFVASALAIATVAIALVAPRAYAEPNPPAQQATDSGASLKETLDWLKDKISAQANTGGQELSAPSADGITPVYFSWTTTPENFTSCEISWTDTSNSHFHIRQGEVTETRVHRTVVPLWEDYLPVTAARDGASAWDVPLMLKDTKAQKILITTHHVVRNVDLPPESDDSVQRTWQTNPSISFGAPSADNQDIAQRVAQAFNHAIQLCQSQKPDPHPGEPF